MIFEKMFLTLVTSLIIIFGLTLLVLNGLGLLTHNYQLISRCDFYPNGSETCYYSIELKTSLAEKRAPAKISPIENPVSKP